ncbi:MULTISPECIES: hypothetical protein [Myroides]|uniref:hypothetical protein n=1 Tax=Myroides TaxID=76831 RepID=UPI000280A625|nr:MULTISPECIES: hypothetical protein [Myroides]APA93838.1 hypothetical protein BK054_16750 [Myroides sp. ZB35]EKB05546.1 hypothetical protein HMPREF9711_01112 [Myroides odoratimimus CCUG 3837]
MKNKLFLVFIMILPGILLAQGTRIFPYKLALTGTSKPPEILEGVSQNAPLGTARYTKDGIMLTSDVKYGFSGFSLNQLAFTSEFGLIIEFEYAMYGGVTYGGRYGDGMSFFMYDGSQALSLGQVGAALGYTYRNDPGLSGYNPNIATHNGLKGGYLGVGLDVYGRYKLQVNNSREVNEGVPPTTAGFNDIGANHVTLRGAVNPANNKGYPVLITKQISGVDEQKYSGAQLNVTNGNYTFDPPYPLSKDSFVLRTSKAANGVVSYNKVKIELVPKTVGEMTVNVYVTNGNVTRHIIQDYKYVKSLVAKNFDGKAYSLNTVVPKTFKIGFAASTGAATQFTLVRNVSVDLPFAPFAKMDVEEACISLFPINKGKQIVFNPFSNDTFFNGSLTGYPSGGNSSTHIDANSFRFEDANGNPLGTTGANASYVQAGVGTWSYNASTRLVTLTLSQDTYGTSNSVKQLFYSAKGTSVGGGPFNNEYYRSAPAAMELRLYVCPDEARVNPNFSIEKN